MARVKILVTGGLGYIGSHVCAELLRLNFVPVIVDNLSTGHKFFLEKLKGAVFYKGDFSELGLLQRIVNEQNIEGVMHLAAFSCVGESFEKEKLYFENNFEKTKVMVDFLESKNINKLIFSSTASVYGDEFIKPFEESDKPKPCNPYAASKLAVEEYLKEKSNCLLKATSLRFFNVSGANLEVGLGELHDPETHLIPSVLINVLKGKSEISIFGNDFDTADGTCVRDYLNVKDIAKAHVLALNKIKLHSGFEIFNLSNQKGFSVNQVVEQVEKCLNIRINKMYIAKRRGDPAKLIGNSKKAQEVLQWTAEESELQTLISQSWKWLNLNKNFIMR